MHGRGCGDLGIGGAEVTGGWTEVEFLTGTAGPDVFDFSAGGTLAGDADGLAGMDVFNINGAGTAAANLIGGADADTFNLNGNVFTGVVDGSAGGADMDLLTGSNDYQIMGADLGTSGEVTGGWTEIESLVGTAGVDVITVAGGALSGTADGLAMSDTLAGDTLYTVTGANSGTSASVAVWQMIENLTGTGGVDMFNFSAGGTLAGDAATVWRVHGRVQHQRRGHGGGESDRQMRTRTRST